MVKVSLSHISIVLSLTVVFSIVFATKYWRNDNEIISNDVLSYYSYLTSTFIYQDITLKFSNKQSDEVFNRIWYQELEDKSRVIKTTMGVSLCYMPLFIITHQLAPALGYIPNGYTLPYRLSIVLSAMLFFVIGLFYLRLILLRFYSEPIAAITLLGVAIGTNVVNYVVYESGMGHVYSFALIAVFIHYTFVWYEKYSLKTLLLLGTIGGLIVLIRPTNGIILLFFILYGINSFKAIGTRVKLFISNWRGVTLAILCAFLVILPQLFYWKYNSGHWAFFSYSDNEHFFFNDPKIIDGLFSYRKGWLLYTPIMSFAVLGLLFNRKELRVSSVFILSVLIFVTFSWWSWWYGGSFGARPFIDFYSLFALSIAAFIGFVMKKSKWLTIGVSLVIAFFIYLNLFQSYQYRNELLHYSDTTNATYWGNFLKTEPYETYKEDLIEIDNEAAKNGER
jgi:hypothetical protein